MIFTDAQQVEQACTQNEFAGILETNKASVVRELSTSDYFELTGYTFQRGTFQDLEKESIIANIKNSIFNQNLTDRLKLISDIGLVEILDAICLNENVNQSEVIENILHEISERSISEQLEFYQYLNKGSLRTTTRVIEVLSGRNIANTFVHESINALLREEILGLADDELVARLLADPSNTHALLEVFEYLDADSSSLLLFDIHRLSKGNADTQDFLLEAWDNALQNVEIEARAEFVKLLIYNSSERNHETVVSVLESSSNLDQLCLLTNLVGVDRLLSCNSQKILELCAMSELYPKIRAINFPSVRDCSQDFNLAIKNFKSACEEIVTICDSDSVYSNTQVAKDLVRIAKSSLVDFDKDAQLVTDSLSAFEQAFGVAMNQSQKDSVIAELLKCYIKMSELERTYALNITYGPASIFDSFLGLSQDSRTEIWKMEELEAIEKSLQAIPEGHILFSPLLSEIQKVKYIGPGVLAARYYDGVIKVTEQASISPEIAKHYPEVHPLAVVFTHELGHSLQIGDENLEFQKIPANTIDLGERRYSFDDYMIISGWEVLDPARWELIEPLDYFSSPTVMLDGVEYPIGETIEHKGKKLILQYRGKHGGLLACKADSEFASRWYAKVSPWEDFAEAFAEYILVPERLILLAPQKFKFMEQEFGKYKESAEIQLLLKYRLELEDLGVVK